MKRPEEPSELDWSLLAAMEAVSVLVRADAARDLREERLTPGGVTLLELVQLQPGETSSGLAAQLGVTRQAASKAVAVLLEEGLLETRASTEDARALRITVTTAGRRALVRARARRAASVEALLQTLSQKERATLLTLMERMRTARTGSESVLIPAMAFFDVPHTPNPTV